MRYADALAQFKRDYWLAQLELCGGSASEVGRQSGVSRTHVYALLKRYGLAYTVKHTRGHKPYPVRRKVT